MFKEIVDLFSLWKMRGNMINKGKRVQEERNKLHSIPVLRMRQSEMAFDIGVVLGVLFPSQMALNTYL